MTRRMSAVEMEMEVRTSIAMFNGPNCKNGVDRN